MPEDLIEAMIRAQAAAEEKTPGEWVTVADRAAEHSTDSDDRQGNFAKAEAKVASRRLHI
jgi:hypothetical protein